MAALKSIRTPASLPKVHSRTSRPDEERCDEHIGMSPCKPPGRERFTHCSSHTKSHNTHGMNLVDPLRRLSGLSQIFVVLLLPWQDDSPCRDDLSTVPTIASFRRRPV